MAQRKDLNRRPEPEYMDDPAEAHAYAAADFAAVNQAFAERAIAEAGTAERLDALDLGTGPGDIPLRVARLRPRWRITAVDASPAMLDLAREAIAKARLARRIALVQADAKHTGLPSAAFDCIFTNSLLHHVTDAAGLWAEIKRLARPGAAFFLRDLARPPSAERARAIVATYAGGESDLLREEYHRSLLSAYTVDEIRAQLAAAGIDGLTVGMITDRHLDVFGRMP